MSSVTAPSDTNTCLASTRWCWIRVEMRPAPQGQRGSVRSTPSELVAESRRRLQRKAMRTPLPATLKLRGGPECYVEVCARGQVFRFHGATSVYDMLKVVSGNPDRGAGGH